MSVTVILLWRVPSAILATLWSHIKDKRYVSGSTGLTLNGAQDDISRARLLKTLAYYLSFVALGLCGVTLGPTLQRLAEHTGVGLSQISILFVARPIGYMTGSFFSGNLYDRRAGHPVVAMMLIATALTMALVPLMPQLWLLCAVIVVLGLVEGAVDVGGNTLLVWTHGVKVGPFMNGLHFCWSLGAFLSPLVIAWGIQTSADIILPYWVLGVSALPAALFLLRLPSPKSRQAGEGPASAPFDLRLALMFVSFFFLFVGVEVTFGGWAATYARSQGLNEVTAAYLTSSFWGGLMLGRLLSVGIGAFVKPRTVLTIDLLGCLACVLIILLLPQSETAMWLGTFGEGLFMASMFATTLVLAEQRLGITGKLTGWFLVGSAAGGMTVPFIVGQLYEPVGPHVVMLMAAAALVAAMVVFAAIQAAPAARRLVQPDGEGA